LKHQNSDDVVSLVLEPRTVYVLCGETRYEWGHEVPAGTVRFRDRDIVRGRRISVILRDHVVPKQTIQSNSNNREERN